MKNKLIISCFWFLIIALYGCERTVTSPKSPFTIQTFFGKGNNFINDVFALPDNTLIILTHDRTNSITKLYKFSSQLRLMDSLIMNGHSFSKPVIENDNSFVMVGENVDQIYGVTAVKIDFNLNLVKKKYIQFLYSSVPGAARYYNKLTRLINGNYVLANTYEIYPEDKIVMFCVKDIFSDTKALWRINPPGFTKEWIEILKSDTKGNFYIGGNDHMVRSKNFVIKYDSSGNFKYYQEFPQTFENFNFYIGEQEIIYHDFWNYYILDEQLNKIKQTTIGGNQLNEKTSDLIRKGTNFYYTSDLYNSDGNFVEIRKTDSELNTIKKRTFGNRGTNSDVPSERFFVELTSGDMVAITLVENPDLSGNMWLLQKIDAELEMDK